MKTILLIAVLALGLAFTGSAQASSSDWYAGISREAAVAKTKTTLIGYAMVLGGLTLKQATVMRHALDAENPRVSKSQCGGRKAWRVVFKGSTPVFVRKGGGSVGCPGLAFHD